MTSLAARVGYEPRAGADVEFDAGAADGVAAAAGVAVFAVSS